MEKREILSPGALLCLRRSAASTPETWEIGGTVGEGGACVCYNAMCGSKSGRLKEHYPLDNLGRPLFNRHEKGFLSAPAPILSRESEDFKRAYELIENAKSGEGGALLNNFIPPYELLLGEGGSVYVWTPDDKQGLSFDRYLREVRSNIADKPEHKLYNILSAVTTLSDCIRVLHREGLLHLDIKPSNFLVLYDGEFNIKPSGISLFDVNTLYPIDSPAFRAAGTEHYCAPELLAGRGDNRSDIYSIGAMLLRAIVFSEDGTEHSYHSEEYEQLDAILAEAPLLRASDANSNVFLRHTLAQILKNCLARRSAMRYSCCEELIADLKKATAFLLPQVAGDELGEGKRLALLDAESAKNRSSAAVLHDLLFRNPPEKNLAEGEDELSVLVLGTGTYGQKFMDIVLQSCQIPGKKLSIHAFSRSPELDKDVYLRLRPALCEFVCIDGKCSSHDSWAEIYFHALPLGMGGGSEDSLRRLLRLCGGKAHFAFVALGKDELNEHVAEALAEALSRRGNSCDIHYAAQTEKQCSDSLAHPLWVNAPLSAKSIDPRLEKWAFNAHLCWMGGEKADIALAKRQLRRKYNLESSLAYALSLPSKLRSVGIDEASPEKAAEAFSRMLLQPENEAMLGALVAMEHRRWVLEKVCSGWRSPRLGGGEADLLGGILRGDMKDLRRRCHPCILRSGEAMPLKSFSEEMWATPGSWDEKLDELDSLSVRLHRLCLRRMENLRSDAVLGEVAIIRRSLAGCEAAMRAFERYRRNLKSLLDGSGRAALRFNGCENALISALDALDNAQRDEIRRKLHGLRREIFPALHALLRRDYKQSDEELIRRIPFVLTYSPMSDDGASIWDDDESSPAKEYRPTPVPTGDIVLPPELLGLTERIAENVHDVWAAERMGEGWVYGEYRDSELKTTPDLVPYSALPEGEKEYDRKTALETLKLIIKLGYRIEPIEKE